jgi:hypothetical protein
MRIFMLTGVLALVLAACGGGGTSGTNKQAAATSLSEVNQRVSKAFSRIRFASVRPQAGEVYNVNCDSGTMSFTFTGSSSGSSGQGTFSVQATNCVIDGATLSANFTMNYSVVTSGNNSSISISYNGNITYSDSSGSDSMTFNNLSMTANVQGNAATVTINGSVVINGETFVFNNETYSATG